jgi:AcrR family transcriptional regulator/DNA-binding MarR family transcriptional regulator
VVWEGPGQARSLPDSFCLRAPAAGGSALMAAEISGEPSMPGRRSGGGLYAADLQRGRLISATFALVGERGYEGLTARAVSEQAGVSNRTFYECFSDREDCFLAAFNYAVDGLERELRAGWDSELGWTARVRAALAALLMALDREPDVRRLVFVEALAAGPRVLARRASVLQGLAGVVDQGRVNAPRDSAALSPLVAEGVVGATFSLIHARLLERHPGSLVGLLGGVMAIVLLPYRGITPAARELARPVPRPLARRRDGDGLSHRALSAASPTDYRLTVRTQMALAAVGGRPGLNNLEVSEIIGLADQGQISRMMKRLQAQGLIENTQGRVGRQARAWRLTADGEAVIDAHRPLKQAQRKLSRGGKLVAPKSGRRGKTAIAAAGTEVSSTGLRMTTLTREVLAAVAELGGLGSSPSNREIAQAAGVKDEGQISKLLRRLEDHGMLKNSGGNSAGANAWHLTPRGEEFLSADRPVATKEAR